MFPHKRGVSFSGQRSSRDLKSNRWICSLGLERNTFSDIVYDIRTIMTVFVPIFPTAPHVPCPHTRDIKHTLGEISPVQRVSSSFYLVNSFSKYNLSIIIIILHNPSFKVSSLEHCPFRLHLALQGF